MHSHNHEEVSVLDKVLDIKVLIKQKSNPKTVERMLSEGYLYKVNYGVSIDDLRLIAKNYMNDHELALALYQDDFRECKIIATLIDNPLAITNEQFDNWAADFNNTEIIDMACSNALCKSKFALVRSLEWCIGDNELFQRAGLILIGKNAASPAIGAYMLEPYVEIIEGIAESATSITRDAMAFALREFAKNSPEMQHRVDECAVKLSTYKNEVAAKVAADLLL